MGKVAVIRDMAAVTYAVPAPNYLHTWLTYRSFEAMVYFLYTGEITFAPLGSDPGHELPVEERTGDWSIGRVPSPSAKSMYRLADKVTSHAPPRRPPAHSFQYDIPALKEQAKAYIHINLAHCNIIDEIFSSFSIS